MVVGDMPNATTIIVVNCSLRSTDMNMIQYKYGNTTKPKKLEYGYYMYMLIQNLFK